MCSNALMRRAAVGDHAAESNEVMYGFAKPPSPNTYAAGDLRGLWREGTSLGCGGFEPPA